MNDKETPHIHALLIGIDCYLPNRLPDGSQYSSLGGCVRDIAHVEHFLHSKLGVPDKHILKLTSKDTGAKEPAEPKETWPTYENMVAAFRKLREMAEPGDQVYIHYSGHGGRARTAYADKKGEGGVDEALVPLDIGKSEAQYLRDLELAYLLKKMVDKGLLVTIVLDSCHAGGATRGGGTGPGRVRVRGLSSIDTTPRPTKSLVASDEELLATWERLAPPITRSVQSGSGWLPEPRGYVLLAACRATEKAYEYTVDSEEFSGALTYWLLDSLRQIGPGFTYKMLHDRIIAKVHTRFPLQTPQLEGEGNRLVFGREDSVSQYAVNVMKVDHVNQQVSLNTGQSQGVQRGARFAVYPAGITSYAQKDKCLAEVEITELGATSSWATITETFRRDAIEQGAQAVLLNPGTIGLRRTVRFVQQEESIVTRRIDQQKALQQVRDAVKLDQTGFVLLAADQETTDYQVAVTEAGEYEIWDPSGEALSNLRPALKIEDSKAAAQLVQRLIHLAKYHNIRELDNFNSPFAGKLVVELLGWQDDYVQGQRPAPKPFGDPGHTSILKPEQWTFLRVKNNSSEVLNITVFDLEPDWGVSQIYPSGGGSFEPLEPGRELLLPPLRVELPAGYSVGTDVLKVFATVGATNYRWLELPSLDQPPKPRAAVVTRGGTINPLEALLAAMAVTKPNSRSAKPQANPSGEWVTAQVEVQVERTKNDS